MIQIYHNSRCGKSRECLAILLDSGKEFEQINYLETTPTASEIKLILKKLNISAIDLIRKKEAIWISDFKHQDLSDDELISVMVKYPILVERPIVVKGNLAIVARPAEKVREII